MSQYMTEQRKMIIAFLERNPDRQFTAKDIARETSARVSISAVYRNLSFLEERGYVSRAVKEGSREVYYQYIECENCKNSLHLTCTKCGHTSHMNKDAAERMLISVLSSDGFEISKPRTVIYGLCKNCKAKNM